MQKILKINNETAKKKLKNALISAYSEVDTVESYSVEAKILQALEDFKCNMKQKHLPEAAKVKENDSYRGKDMKMYISWKRYDEVREKLSTSLIAAALSVRYADTVNPCDFIEQCSKAFDEYAEDAGTNKIDLALCADPNVMRPGETMLEWAARQQEIKEAQLENIYESNYQRYQTR